MVVFTSQAKPTRPTSHWSTLRINAVATALTGGLSLEDLAYLDLAYAPPFSGAWDPLHIAAQQLLK